MSLLATGRLTANEPVLTTWIWVVVELLLLCELWLLPDREPIVFDVRPEPLPEPERFVPPLPLAASCSPTVMLTAETVPLKLATRPEPNWANWAEARASWATVTLDWSAAICSAEALAV